MGNPSRSQRFWEINGTVWNGLLELIYPPVCLVCGADQTDPFCALCTKDIQRVPPPLCDRCGIPISAGNFVCHECLAGPDPPFAWAQTLGVYGGSLRTAIHRLKYDGKTALARPLGKLLAGSMRGSGPLSGILAEPEFDLVVPVPLYPSRRRKRGFNQAELIANILAVEWGWKLDTRGLIRIRKTQSQTTLGAAQRANNMNGAFSSRHPYYFADQSVLIVDDVLTSLATTRECARVVRDAGASRVCIVALAQGL